MTTTTLERPATITEAAPLTTTEGNALIGLVASTDKVARVKGGASVRGSRGWSMQGNVD